MSLRSWVRDKLDDFGTWFMRSVVTPVTDFLRQAIENIVTALRIFRHNLKAKLAEWLQNDAFFLLFIAAAVVAIFYVPKLIIASKTWLVTIWVKSVVKSLKESVVDLFEVNAIIEIVTIHKILVVVFDDYAETFYGFADAVSQLSAELGEGSAYLHAYFSALRSMMHGTNAILGGDPLQVEIEWYGRTSTFFEQANDRFARYARDPGRLIYDFIKEVLIPAAQESSDVSQAQLDEIKENHNRLVEIDEGQKELQLAIDTFIELQPNVLEEQFRERWDEINEAWTEINDKFFSEVMRITTGIMEAVEWRAEQQRLINAEVKRKDESGQHIADMMMQMEDDEQRILGNAYDTVLAIGTEDDRTEFGRAVSMYGRDYDSITREYILSLGISPALGFEPRYAQGRPDLIISIPSPFVGDY